MIWTHGSANFDIDHFQRCALRASEALGLRCLLVSLDPPKVTLPKSAFHFRHVRFEDVFPRCLAAVHHGGIGTTSKAIAAALPQLIIPKSHDQPDNAQRITASASARCSRTDRLILRSWRRHFKLWSHRSISETPARPTKAAWAEKPAETSCSIGSSREFLLIIRADRINANRHTRSFLKMSCTPSCERAVLAHEHTHTG